MHDTRYSRRVRKLLGGISRLEIPSFFESNTRDKFAAPSEAQFPLVYQTNTARQSEAVCRLLNMEHLPPLSPAGQQFAIDVREKTFTHGDVVGKAFSRWLQEGFPFAEEVVGVHRAVQARDNVETLRRGDDKEIRDLLQVGATFERSEKWSADEINNAPRYAGAISTTVMTGRPREQSITDGSDSDTDLSIGMGKTSMYSPVTQILPDEEFSSFNFRARSALRLPSSEALGTDEVSEHSPERENAPRDDHMLGEQLGWEDWSQNPDVWTMESSKCVDSAYEEEDWRSESNRRLLAWTHEMFHR